RGADPARHRGRRRRNRRLPDADGEGPGHRSGAAVPAHPHFRRRHRRQPARPPGRARRRSAGRRPEAAARRHASGAAAAAGRRRHLRAQAGKGRGAPGLEPAGPGPGPACARLLALAGGRGGTGRRTPAHPRRPRPGRSRRRRARQHRRRRPRRHRRGLRRRPAAPAEGAARRRPPGQRRRLPQRPPGPEDGMSAEAGSPLRAAAARVLAAVLGQGRSLRAELAAALPRWPDPRDRALLEAICFQALRHRRRYEYVLEAWMQRPLPPREQLVHCLLLAGLAQLDALKLPGHAAVAATAGAARALGRPQMVGLVNALLRRAAREAWPVCDAPAIALSHPDWLVAALQADWPGHWQDILAANNAAAPMWLRRRPRHGDVATLSSALEQAGIAGETDPALPGALRLDTPVPVQRIPGWADGSASVQDGSAQLAVLALAPRPGERVLDACAAPGGKAAHIAECLQGEGELLALDQDVRRLARVDETLARLGLAAGNVSTRAADAGDTRAWWDGRPFDAILLDA